MTIAFDCPFCSYTKQVPDNYLHKKLKCPRCLATLTLGLPQPTALTALPLPEDDEDSTTNQQTPIEVEKNDSMQECPFCFEMILRSDKECPICHCMLDADSITAKFNVSFHPQAKRILYIGAFSFVGGIGILFGIFALWQTFKIIADVKHPKERELIYTGAFMAFLGIIISLILLVLFLV